MPASGPSKEPVAELVSRLEAMTDDEVFAAMDALETASERRKMPSGRRSFRGSR